MYRMGILNSILPAWIVGEDTSSESGSPHVMPESNDEYETVTVVEPRQRVNGVPLVHSPSTERAPPRRERRKVRFRL